MTQLESLFFGFPLAKIVDSTWYHRRRRSEQRMLCHVKDDVTAAKNPAYIDGYLCSGKQNWEEHLLPKASRVESSQSETCSGNERQVEIQDETELYAT